MNKLLLVIATTILLAACGSSLEGDYADEVGVFELKLESNGKAIFDGQEGTYEVDGDKINFTIDGTTLDATVNNDGSIGFMGSKLVKKN